jgi:hypothetical protein
MTPLHRSRRTFVKTSLALAGATPLLAYAATFSSPLRDVLPTQVDLPPGNGRGIHLFQANRTTGALTPAGVHGQRPRTIDLLSRFSRDVWSLTFTGNVQRLREVLSAEPERAKAAGDGETPLMWLPGDEARAKDIVRLFLAHGADPAIRNKDGMTAADLAGKRGLDEAAALLRAGAKPR